MKKFLVLIVLSILCVSVFAQEITWMNYAQPQEKAIFDKLIAKFEELHPGVTIKFISTTQDQFGPKIQAAMAANNLPDVFYVGPNDIRTYVDNNKILELTPYIEKAKANGVNIDDVFANALNKYRYDGTNLGVGPLYGLPKDLGPFAFGYNVDLFKKTGIPLPDKDVPYTFEEFKEVCRKLTVDKNGDGKMDQWGTGLNVHWSLIQFIWGNGADYLDETKTKVTIDEPKFIEALQYWADMTLKYEMTPTAGEAQSMDTYQRWLKGEIGFFPVAPWDLAAFQKLNFEYDLCPWPVAEKGMKSATWVGSVGYAVSKTTKYPELAAEFAMFLCADEEANKMMCDLDLQVPNLQSLSQRYVDKSKTGKPRNREEYIQIIGDYGRSWPAEYTYNSVWYNEFFINIQRVLDGKVTAAEYCATMQPKMQKLLDRANKKMNAKKAKAK